MFQRDLLVGLENVSQLVNRDRPIFEKMLRRDNSLDYSDCWAYLVQSTFFGQFKFYDGKNFVAFTTHTPASPVFVITKAVGSNPRQAILQLARLLRERTGEKVIVKNLSEYDYEFLLLNGLEDYRTGDCWNQFYKYDDETFPEPVVDLDEVLSLKGGELKRLRFRLRQFTGQLVVKNYNPVVDFPAVEKLLVTWGEDVKKRYNKMLTVNDGFLHSIALHRQFALRPEGTPLLFTLNNEPVGFAMYVLISCQAVALYSLFCDNTCDGLSEHVYLETLRKAREAGFRYCNLGGSEFETLRNYKLKFAPFQLIQKKHAVLY
ncbi:MAG: phosphatidylglycerol lysyltransferase domain-containing protein [Candidatus Micrarchaeota archaeon]